MDQPQNFVLGANHWWTQHISFVKTIQLGVLWSNETFQAKQTINVSFHVEDL
jgi:hypothetical protein